jgi:hypothetical protein
MRLWAKRPPALSHFLPNKCLTGAAPVETHYTAPAEAHDIVPGKNHDIFAKKEKNVNREIGQLHVNMGGLSWISNVLLCFWVEKRVRRDRVVSKKVLGGVALHSRRVSVHMEPRGVPIRDIFDYFPKSDLITSLTPE